MRAVTSLLSGVALLGAVTACGSDEPPDRPAPAPAPEAAAAAAAGAGESVSGHERMLALLQEIAASTPEQNGFLGDGPARKARAAAASLPPGAPPVQRIQAYTGLGIAELRLGNNVESIAAFERARAAAEALPGPGRARYATPLAFYLGLANLRWGETQNCVAQHTSESCILPIGEGGVHVDQDGSRAAIRYFQAVVDGSRPGAPERLAARWLLNIAYMTVGEYPDGVPEGVRIPPAVFASDQEFPRFVDVAPELGLNTFNLSGGALVEDYTGDDRLDIVQSTWDTRGQLRLFVNRGDGSFEERTEEAGLTGLFGGLNLVHADYDDDGDFDILVLRGAWLPAAMGKHPNSLLQNDGAGHFRDVTFEAGLGAEHYPTQTAAWADYDLDGDLDLYVGNEAGPGAPFPCQLFRSRGDGTFEDVSKSAGVENLRYAKGVTWGDYDGDRYPDLFVSNLGDKNRLYHNEGDGTFRDVAPELGLTGPSDSFPTWFWDFDNDGNLDLFVSSYYQAREFRLVPVVASYLGLEHGGELAALYRGDGKGGFRDVAREKNLVRVSLPMGSNYGDLDGDGFLDFYLGTGYPFYDGLMPNVMYRNVRGESFADVTTAGGFGHVQKGHGVAFADLDDDGDQDVFEQMGGAYPGDAFGNVLYENPGFGTHWLKVRLVGTESTRSGLGARLKLDIVENGTPRSVYRHVTSGGSFGGNPFLQHVGVGAAERIERLEVFWPRTGKTQAFEDVAVDQYVRITEGSDELEVIPREATPFKR